MARAGVPAPRRGAGGGHAYGRLSGTHRLLTFEAHGLTVEVQVTALGTRRHMIGQLIPNWQARVMVRHQDGIATVDADRSGRFRVDDLPSGPGSLRCHLGGEQAGPPVVTDWVML